MNLAVLRMGASPVCLKLTITFPSLTAEADNDIRYEARKIVANRARTRAVRTAHGISQSVSHCHAPTNGAHGRYTL